MTDQAGEIDVFETVEPIWCFERMPIETCYLFIEKLIANGKAWKMIMRGLILIMANNHQAEPTRKTFRFVNRIPPT